MYAGIRGPIGTLARLAGLRVQRRKIRSEEDRDASALGTLIDKQRGLVTSYASIAVFRNGNI